MKNQLYFSLNPTSSITSWFVDWNWYDAAGLRLVAQVSDTAPSLYLSSVNPDQVGGYRTYYYDDGAQVSLSVVGKKGGPWFVRQRFLSAGVDRPLVGWFNGSGTGPVKRLALVGDRQGTTMTTMTRTGGYETSLNYFGSDPFGRPENSTVTAQSLHPETGFTGATAPSQGGGFVYLRNRWYDPQTGRFLTQDPIGLAGGVNLYAYAGNNPITFSDPFGLCDPPDSPICKFIVGVANRVQGLHALEPAMLVVASLPTFGAGEAAPIALGIGGGGRAAAALAPTATNVALRNTLAALYRAGDRIPGGTAGAIRNEAITGEATGGVLHLKKGIERIVNLERILRREELNAADRATAEKALAELRDAVKFAEEQAKKGE